MSSSLELFGHETNSRAARSLLASLGRVPPPAAEARERHAAVTAALDGTPALAPEPDPEPVSLAGLAALFEAALSGYCALTMLCIALVFDAGDGSAIGSPLELADAWRESERRHGLVLALASAGRAAREWKRGASEGANAHATLLQKVRCLSVTMRHDGRAMVRATCARRGWPEPVGIGSLPRLPR